jgi:hypothetical protein
MQMSTCHFNSLQLVNLHGMLADISVALIRNQDRTIEIELSALQVYDKKNYNYV